MKYLHIMHNEKFNNSYIEFIEKNFDMKEHFFIFWGGISEDQIKIIDRANILKIKREKNIFNLINSIIKLIKYMNKSKKIYIHALFNRYIILLLYLQTWLLKRTHWVLWGGDLYGYSDPKITLKSKILEYIKSKVIRNMGYILTHIKGDYYLAKKVYKTKAKHLYTFMYLSNTFKNNEIFTGLNKGENEKIYIQVGNSGDKRNYHKYVFNILEKYKEKNINIICPLAYGDKTYIQEISELGTKMFGDKFSPILELMPYEEYIKVLQKVDIAIFNHDRQQAVGNITQLLGLGKKVYIRDDVTTWDFAKEHGLTVYPTNKIDDTLFDIDKKVLQNNIKSITEKFSLEKLKQDWEVIFDK